MAEQPTGDPVAVINLLDFWTPLMLRAVVEAGVLEAIGDARRDVVEVAAETGVHAPTLMRVLRALAGRGVVDEGADGSFALTPMSRPLLADHPRSLRGMAPFNAFNFHAWAEFEHTLRGGAVAFEHHYGMAHFEWLAAHPELSARFDAVMARRTASMPRASIPLVDRLPERGTLVDVGGGSGSFLAWALSSRPELRGDRVRPTARRRWRRGGVRDGRASPTGPGPRVATSAAASRPAATRTRCSASSTTGTTMTPCASCSASGRRLPGGRSC